MVSKKAVRKGISFLLSVRTWVYGAILANGMAGADIDIQAVFPPATENDRHNGR